MGIRTLRSNQSMTIFGDVFYLTTELICTDLAYKMAAKIS